MAAQKKIALNLVEKLNKNLESEAKSMDEAVNKAITTVKQDFLRKRSELKTKHKKLREEEQEVMNNYKRDDITLQQEIDRIGIQIEALTTAEQALPQVDPHQDFHRKSQQMVQIFSDTYKEMEALTKEYKEKIKRFEQVYNKNTNQEKKFTQIAVGATNEINQLKAIFDQKNSSQRDLINKLDDIRHEIDRKNKELMQIDKRETEELTEAEKKCTKEETAERKEETNRFMKKALDLFNK